MPAALGSRPRRTLRRRETRGETQGMKQERLAIRKARAHLGLCGRDGSVASVTGLATTQFDNGAGQAAIAAQSAKGELRPDDQRRVTDGPSDSAARRRIYHGHAKTHVNPTAAR